MPRLGKRASARAGCPLRVGIGWGKLTPFPLPNHFVYSQTPIMIQPHIYIRFRRAMAINVLPVAEPDRGTREGLVGGSAATGASNRMLSCRVVFCPRENNNGADIAFLVLLVFSNNQRLRPTTATILKYPKKAPAESASCRLLLTRWISSCVRKPDSMACLSMSSERAKYRAVARSVK